MEHRGDAFGQVDDGDDTRGHRGPRIQRSADVRSPAGRAAARDAFQKQNNTFAQRHHLRIWHRPDTFDDKEVWVCAATHDIAIDFSPEDRTFIHRIDPQIDRERAKVVNDLMFTGRVRGMSLVSRSDVPKDAYNATGDQLITDGRMAVLEF